MAKRYKKTKRAAEVTGATILVLGLGAVVAGVVIYQFSKPATATTPQNPGQLTPSGTGVQTALNPSPQSVT